MLRKLALCGSALLIFHAEAALAATTTTNYGLNKPSVGADAAQWGAQLNGDMDTIDSTMKSISGVANAACPKAGCTFTGAVSVGNSLSVSGSNTLFLTGAAGTYRPIDFQTGGSDRWHISASGDAESGSNVGTKLQFQRFTDAGAYIDTPLNLDRDTGLLTANDGARIVGGLTVASGTTTLSAGTATVPAIKASAGTLLTTPVAGAVEFDGSNAYYTQTTGPTRRKLAFADGSNLGSGAVASSALATVNSAPATSGCGDATHVCAVTTNGQGQVTAQTATAIATATGAQVITGTDNAHFVTPASLTSQQAQNVSCGTNCTGGYVTRPGGLIEEWGHYDCGSTGCWNGAAITVTFPLAFPSGCYSLQALTDNAGSVGSDVYAAETRSVCTTTSVVIATTGYNSGSPHNIEGFYWFAIGH